MDEMEIRLTNRTPGTPYPEARSAWYLTTDDPASHYGIPVLSHDDGRTIGPADIAVVVSEKAHGYFGAQVPDLTGADVVLLWAERNVLTAAEIEAVRLYLGQYREGRQLTSDHDELRNSQEYHTAHRLEGARASAYDH